MVGQKGVTHVKDIEKMVDGGQFAAAHEALDQLLMLGPKNTGALKLRALLLVQEGRFADEAAVWERILRIDSEDTDAVAFAGQRELEDRENFYFTDDLPGGGRRFLAYPRSLVNASVFGLFGCVTFLVLSRLAQTVPILAHPMVMLGLFGLLVLGPWFAIMTSYMKALKWISVTRTNISVATRFQVFDYQWTALRGLYIAHSSSPTTSLALILVPVDAGVSSLEINLDRSSGSIRARGHLIEEIRRRYADPVYVDRNEVVVNSQHHYKY